MPLTVEDILAQRRRDSTVAERMVLALEDIAAHLKSLQIHFLQDAGGERAAAVESDPVGEGESEGVKPHEDAGLPPGVERRATEFFMVGPYRYTRLDDALAQARRGEDGTRARDENGEG